MTKKYFNLHFSCRYWDLWDDATFLKPHSSVMYNCFASIYNQSVTKLIMIDVAN